MFSKTRISKINILVVLVGFLILLVTQNAFGIIRHDDIIVPGFDPNEPNDPNCITDLDYREFGAKFPSTYWAGDHRENGAYGIGCAVFITDGDPNDNNYWALVSGHALRALQGALLVATGSDLFKDPGEIIYATRYWSHPDYNEPGDTFFTPDIGLAYFEDVNLIDPNLVIHTVERYRKPLELYDRVSICGFGRPGTPTLGIQPADYTRRACHGLVDEFGFALEGIPTDYVLSTFIPYGWGKYTQQLGGVVAPGDSGGGWYVHIKDFNDCPDINDIYDPNCIFDEYDIFKDCNDCGDVNNIIDVNCIPDVNEIYDVNDIFDPYDANDPVQLAAISAFQFASPWYWGATGGYQLYYCNDWIDEVMASVEDPNYVAEDPNDPLAILEEEY